MLMRQNIFYSVDPDSISRLPRASLLSGGVDNSGPLVNSVDFSGKGVEERSGWNRHGSVAFVLFYNFISLFASKIEPMRPGVGLFSRSCNFRKRGKWAM